MTRVNLLAKMRFTDLRNELRYSLHVMVRPFDGFWDLKHEKRGSLRAAYVIVAMLIVTWISRWQFSGFFMVNPFYRMQMNIFQEAATIILPFALWVVANWCLTTLMDGEGSMRDIAIATAYALMPLIVINIPVIFISNFLTLEESALLVTIQGVAVVWTGFLLFVSVIVVHQYTIIKAIVTIILSLIGVAVILFVSLLMLTLLQQVLGLVVQIIREARLRWS